MSAIKSMISLTALGLVALPAGVMAAEGAGDAGPYFAIGGGITIADDVEQDTQIAPFSGVNNVTVPAGFDTGFDTGFNLDGLIGYKFNSYWRVEGELRYSSSDIDATTARGQFFNVPTPLDPSGQPTANSGDASVTALFANAILDINMAGRLTPYLGAGFGYADVDISGLGSDSGEGVYAYQVLAGADVSIDEKSWIGARFQWMNTGDFDYDPVGLNTVGGAFTLEDTQYSAFDLTISYRRKLNK